MAEVMQLGGIKQVDINVGKWVQVSSKLRIQPEVSLFNVLNNRAMLTVRSQNFLTSSYLQPSSVLQPRLVRGRGLRDRREVAELPTE